VSVAAARVDVTSSATRLDADLAAVRRGTLLVRNKGTAAVYLGPSNVTTSTGFQLDPDESVSIDLDSYTLGLYGRAASGTHTCHVLQVGS